VHLQRRDGNWVQIDKPGLFRRHAVDTSQADVQIDACPVCFGAWFDAGELDTLAGDLGAVEKILAPEARPSTRPCPHGHGAMHEHDLEGLITTPVDRCGSCGGIWLDGHERRKLATATTSEGQGTKTQRWLKRGAIWAAQVLTHLPVEVENPARSTPWIVFAILATLLGVFAAQELGQIDTVHYGLVPGRLRKYGGFENLQTLWSHIFLHGGWAHLLGNAYFLYTFGDNVEYLFGRLRFAVFFLATGIFAGLIHYALTTKTATPVVGASGAISGVLAAYLWAFPRQRLSQVILWIQIKIPVWVYLIVWLGFHVVMGFFGTGRGAQEVAWFAHLGGFAAGLAIAPLMLRRRRRVVARSVRVPAIAV
jgi:membrane associated rhomboid family serine protease/Zn-finger nucleic acid-binding protein